MFNKDMLVLVKDQRSLSIQIYEDNLLEQNLILKRLKRLLKCYRKAHKHFLLDNSSDDNKDNDNQETLILKTIEWDSAIKGINNLVSLAVKINLYKLPHNFVQPCFNLFRLDEVSICFCFIYFLIYSVLVRKNKSYNIFIRFSSVY